MIPTLNKHGTHIHTHTRAFGHLPHQPTSIFSWKLSWNNRYLWGKNQVWTMNPLNVAYMHSPLHSHSIVIASIYEHNLPFTNCVLNSHLDGFVADFNNCSFWKDGEEYFHHLILDGDWVSTVCELACPPAFTSNLNDPVCWKCGVNKIFFWYKWFLDLFKWWDTTLTTSHWLNATFSSVPMEDCRYCWMHGVSNLLSNALINVYNYLPFGSCAKGEFVRIMAEIKEGWSTDNLLVPIKMKYFFNNNYLH